MADLDMLMAREKGISSPYPHTKFMPFHTDKSGRIVLDDLSAQSIAADLGRNAGRMAMDSAAVLQANIGIPVILTTYLDPRIVEVLFAPMNAAKFFAPTKYGSWTDEQAQFSVEEIDGEVTPYADYADNSFSGVNYNFPVRQQLRYQTMIRYGDLETEKASQAKIALVARKQYAAAQIIARNENKFQLYGVKGKMIYGMLNDPNLNASISPISMVKPGTESDPEYVSTWPDKQATYSDRSGNIFYSDVNSLISELNDKNQGLIDLNGPMILGISPKRYALLADPNIYGKSAKELLAENYPGLEIVQLPELSATEGETLYLVVPQILGDEAGFTAYSEKMRFSRLITHTTSFEQKAFAGTWGCVIRHPSLVARMVGI